MYLQIYMQYPFARKVESVIKKSVFEGRGFGAKMTVEQLIAKQTRIERYFGSTSSYGKTSKQVGTGSSQRKALLSDERPIVAHALNMYLTVVSFLPSHTWFLEHVVCIVRLIHDLCYRQEEPHCASVSFDRHAANIFQTYVASALAFSIKRGGILYGNKDEEGNTMVHAIYEPPQVLHWHIKQSRQKRTPFVQSISPVFS